MPDPSSIIAEARATHRGVGWSSFVPRADPATLAHEAHVIVAMAGSLGFEDLAAACRTLDVAITAGTGLPEAVMEARRAAEAARLHCAAA